MFLILIIQYYRWAGSHLKDFGSTCSNFTSALKIHVLEIETSLTLHVSGLQNILGWTQFLNGDVHALNTLDMPMQDSDSLKHMDICKTF